MAITPEEIAREKGRLPFGWGRFGKALDQLAELSEPDESLVSSCVGLNPDFKYKQRGVPGGLWSTANAIHALTQTMNVVLACTTERLIAVSTGAGGAPRDHAMLPLEGVEVVERAKKEFVLGWPDGQMRVKGAAKQQVPGFLDAVAAGARPAIQTADPAEAESADPAPPAADA
jgi:hypothetical protein